MNTLTNEGLLVPVSTDDFYVQTNEVWSDEPAAALIEFDLARKDGKGYHRYQQIHVVRGERLAEFTYDLGPSGNFTANGFVINGCGSKDADPRDWETVDSIRDYADEIRSRGGFVRSVAPTVTQENWARYAEEQERRRQHRSTFGSAVAITR